MPAYVLRPTDGPQAALLEPTLEAFRGCALQGYEPINVPPVKASEEIISYTSPDSTYAVTKRLIDGAKKSILIGIYDFSAHYMKELLFTAMSRGVKVSLMLDLEDAGEKRLFEEMIAMGVDGVVAPACTSKRAQFFSSCHEKFIVIDGIWTLVQSGNYSNNSIPLNEKDGGDPKNFVTGNRDTGLAVKSKTLAKFFSQVLRADMALELNAIEQLPESLARLRRDAIWVEAAPQNIPSKLFASKRFKLTAPLVIQPVLSPDNYMARIPDFLQQAKRSILIEQQYIRASQENIAILLAAMVKARDANPALDIRIVLGKIFGAADIPKEKKNLDLLQKKYGLTLGTNIRYVDTTRLVHCHNKMIIVDGKDILVGSQNWSDSAVSKNREASLLLSHRGIASYFSEIFENDWRTAFKKLPTPDKPKVELEALRAGGFIMVVSADYREV